MDVLAIYEAVAAHVESVTGLKSYDYVPDSSNFPCVHSQPFTSLEPKSFGRTDGYELRYNLTVPVKRWNEKAGQKQLQTLATPAETTSVMGALLSAGTLDGVISSLKVLRVYTVEVQNKATGQTEYVAVEFELSVTA